MQWPIESLYQSKLIPVLEGQKMVQQLRYRRHDYPDHFAWEHVTVLFMMQALALINFLRSFRWNLTGDEYNFVSKTQLAHFPIDHETHSVIPIRSIYHSR